MRWVGFGRKDDSYLCIVITCVHDDTNVKLIKSKTSLDATIKRTKISTLLLALFHIRKTNCVL